MPTVDFRMETIGVPGAYKRTEAETHRQEFEIHILQASVGRLILHPGAFEGCFSLLPERISSNRLDPCSQVNSSRTRFWAFFPKR